MCVYIYESMGVGFWFFTSPLIRHCHIHVGCILCEFSWLLAALYIYIYIPVRVCIYLGELGVDPSLIFPDFPSFRQQQNKMVGCSFVIYYYFFLYCNLGEHIYMCVCICVSMGIGGWLYTSSLVRLQKAIGREFVFSWFQSTCCGYID